MKIEKATITKINQSRGPFSKILKAEVVRAAATAPMVGTITTTMGTMTATAANPDKKTITMVNRDPDLVLDPKQGIIKYLPQIPHHLTTTPLLQETIEASTNRVALCQGEEEIRLKEEAF